MLLIVTTLLLVILIIIYIGGTLLPKKIVGTKSDWLDAPSSLVWLIMTDHANENEWRSGVRLVEKVPSSDRKPLWKETHYGKLTYTYKTIESKTRQKLVREIVDHHYLRGTISYSLEEQEGRTKLTISQDFEVTKPLYRYVTQWFSPKTKEMDQYISDLKQRILVIKERNEQQEEE